MVMAKLSGLMSDDDCKSVVCRAETRRHANTIQKSQPSMIVENMVENTTKKHGKVSHKS